MSSRTVLPVFRTEELTEPDRLHNPRCMGALDTYGVAPDRPCRCGAAIGRIGAKVPFEVLRHAESAMLVRTLDHAPVWVEARASLVRIRTPPPKASADDRRRLSPPDYLAVETWLSMGHALIAGRRKTNPEGGDIVLVRRDDVDDTRLWRLLCTVVRDEGPHALLIDASVNQTRALSTSWAQQRLVPLFDSQGKTLPLRRALVPVFPLPDGTPSPGWMAG